MSAQVLLLNPRRKVRHHRRGNPRRGRMPAGLARWHAARARAARRVSNPRPHRRRRSNPRRAYRRRSNPRRVYRRRSNRRSFRGRVRLARRRVSGVARYGRGVLGEYVIPAVVGGTGALALDVIWGYVSPKLPTTMQAGYVALAAKLAVVVGTAMLVNRFRPGMRAQTHTAAVGAATVAVYGALKGIAQSVLPNTIPGLSGYIDYQSYAIPGARMGGYMPRAGLGDLSDFFSPAAVIQAPGVPVPRQFGGYIAAQPGMSGYIAHQPHMQGGGGFAGYDWTNDGM